MENPKRIMLDISWTALFKVVGLAVGIWLAFMLREILIMMLVVFIFVAAVNPTIARMQVKLSRLWAVSLFYLALVLILIGLSYAFVPTLVVQLQELVRQTPIILNKIRPALASLQAGGGANLVDQAISSLSSGLNNISQSLLDSTISLFGGLAIAVSGLVLSFYLLLEEKNAKEFFHQLLPPHRFEAVYDTVSKISERMGMWVRGELSVVAIVAASNFVGFLLIGLHSPLPLGLWTGVCEFIPYLGPTLGMIPALVVAITTGSALQAVLVFVVSFVIVQQLESHILVPRIMSKAIGLSPVLVILALLTGAKIFGLVGAIIAIPTAAIISVVVGEWPQLRKIWEDDPS